METFSARLSSTPGTSPACTTHTAQGSPSSPVSGTSQMPDSPGEAYVVVDLPDTSEIMVVSSDDKPMKGFEGHL